jgi:hypothetical protein
VFAKTQFVKGDFLLNYDGEVIEEKEAIRREAIYAQNNLGCFLFFFKHSGKKLW